MFLNYLLIDSRLAYININITRLEVDSDSGYNNNNHNKGVLYRACSIA